MKFTFRVYTEADMFDGFWALTEADSEEEARSYIESEYNGVVELDLHSVEYRSDDGAFSCCASTFEECKRRINVWLSNKH